MDKIYTKTGDKGFTTNILNKTYSKADIEMELQGGIDEINANVGFLRSIISFNKEKYERAIIEHLDNNLKQVQYHLYLIGIEVSTEFTEIHVAQEEISFLEKEIDYMVDRTEPMKSFIYYSGNGPSSYSHVIRTITRRVERVFVRAIGDNKYPLSYQYINRLSDYFFTLSRFINQLSEISDEPITLK